MEPLINIKSLQELNDNFIVEFDDIQNFAQTFVKKYTEDLDKYVFESKANLQKCDGVVPDIILESIILNLPGLMFWASKGLDEYTLKTEIYKSVYEKKLLEKISNIETKMSAIQKSKEAKGQLIEEAILLLVYDYIAQTIKNSIDIAMELLQSSKKIVSSRMSETSLNSNIQPPKSSYSGKRNVY